MGILSAFAFSLWVAPLGLAAQTETTASQEEPPANSDPDAGQLIQRAYRISKTAANRADFTQTIQLCDQAMEKKTTPAQLKYLRQLKSWSLVERARLHTGIEPTDALHKSMEDCLLATRLDADNWKAHVWLAKQKARLGKTSEAILNLDAAIRKNPSDGNLWFNRAELFFAGGEFEVAITDYTQALKLNKTDVQALTGRAHSYVRLAQHERALLDYSAVVERAGRNAVSFLNRAELHLRMKNFKSAGEDYREALTRNQKLPAAYRGVAWMYATSGSDDYYNPTVADRAIKRAIELDGQETAENLVVLAASQAAGGEYRMARDTLKRVKAVKNLDADCLDRIRFLETRKWFLAGTGKN